MWELVDGDGDFPARFVGRRTVLILRRDVLVGPASTDQSLAASTPSDRSVKCPAQAPHRTSGSDPEKTEGPEEGKAGVPGYHVSN